MIINVKNMIFKIKLNIYTLIFKFVKNVKIKIRHIVQKNEHKIKNNEKTKGKQTHNQELFGKYLYSKNAQKNK